MRPLLACSALVALCGCASPPTASPSPASPASATPRVETSLVGALDGARRSGAFALAPLGASESQTACDDVASCTLRRTPASTFKVPHALFALDRGVITPDTALGPAPDAALEACRPAIDLRAALAASCVPWFQQVATRLGDEGEQELVRGFGYGNQSVGRDLTHFWLGLSDDGVRISPAEQVRFLDRVWTRALPLRRPESVQALLDALPHEQVSGRTIIGKTGWATTEAKATIAMWYVGWVLPNDADPGTAFALVLDPPREGSGHAAPIADQRKPLAFALLAKAGRL